MNPLPVAASTVTLLNTRFLLVVQGLYEHCIIVYAVVLLVFLPHGLLVIPELEKDQALKQMVGAGLKPAWQVQDDGATFQTVVRRDVSR